MSEDETSTTDVENPDSESKKSDETELVQTDGDFDEMTEAPDNAILRSYTAILTAGAAQIAGMVAVGANPLFAGVGAGLVATMSFFAASGQHRKLKRIEELIERLDDRVDEQLGEDTLDEDYLGSEELEDLLRSAFEAAGRARTDEQIELYARILTGAAIQGGREHHDPEAYIELLAALNVRQTKLLRVIWEFQSDVEQQLLDAPSTQIARPWRRPNLEETLPDELHGAVDVALVHLERNGLVVRHYQDPGDRETYPVGVPTVTPMCRRLMEFVNADLSADAVDGPPWSESPSRSAEDRLLFELVRQMKPPSPMVNCSVIRDFAEADGDIESAESALRKLASSGYVELQTSNSALKQDLMEQLAYVNVTGKGLDRYLRVVAESPRELAIRLVQAVDQGKTAQDVVKSVRVPEAAVFRVAQRLESAGLIGMTEFTSEFRVVITDSSAPEPAEIDPVFSR